MIFGFAAFISFITISLIFPVNLFAAAFTFSHMLLHPSGCTPLTADDWATSALVMILTISSRMVMMIRLPCSITTFLMLFNPWMIEGLYFSMMAFTSSRTLSLRFFTADFTFAQMSLKLNVLFSINVSYINSLVPSDEAISSPTIILTTSLTRSIIIFLPATISTCFIFSNSLMIFGFAAFISFITISLIFPVNLFAAAFTFSHMLLHPSGCTPLTADDWATSALVMILTISSRMVMMIRLPCSITTFLMLFNPWMIEGLYFSMMAFTSSRTLSLRFFTADFTFAQMSLKLKVLFSINTTDWSADEAASSPMMMVTTSFTYLIKNFFPPSMSAFFNLANSASTNGLFSSATWMTNFCTLPTNPCTASFTCSHISVKP